MKFSKSYLVAICSFSLAVFAAVFELKSFESWGQVSKLWESEVNPFSNLMHPHMPRYLIVYPGFLLDEYWSGFGFSVYISTFFAANMLLLRKVSLLANKCPPYLAIYLCFASIHLAMNGRGVIVWTAWLICLMVCHKISMRISRPMTQIGWIALSCFLATVSTGVFVVITLAYIFVMREYKKYVQFRISQWILILPILIPLVYYLAEYFFIAVSKNIDHFGGGTEAVFKMLEHGLGGILGEINSLGIMLIFLILCIVGGGVSVLKRRRFSILEKMGFFPIIGGFFGITVLTMILPLLLIRFQGVGLARLQLQRKSTGIANILNRN